MSHQNDLEKLRAENARLQQELSSLKNRLLYNTLEQSINDQHDGLQLQDFLRNNCDFEFSFTQFCLVLLYNRPVAAPGMDPASSDSNWSLSLSDSSEGFTRQLYDNWTPHWDMPMRRKIESIFQKCLAAADCYFIRADRDLCCLINAAALESSALAKALTSAAETIEAESGVKIAAAFSRIQDGSLNLTVLYEECLLIHDYSWNQASAVISSEAMELPEYQASLSAGSEASAAVLERRFLNCITTYEFYQASGILESINQNMFRRQIPLEAAASITLHRLFDVVSMINLPLEEALCADLRDTLNLIRHIRSFPDLQNKTRDFFVQLDDVYAALRQTETSKAAVIMHFIDSNYQNPELGAAMICDRIRISPAYLSKTLKAETGMGVVDAIHAVRLREAKELLRKTNLSIDHIAVQVGFSNRWILIRSFKSRTGMTPSEYRSQLPSAAE